MLLDGGGVVGVAEPLLVERDEVERRAQTQNGDSAVASRPGERAKACPPTSSSSARVDGAVARPRTRESMTATSGRRRAAERRAPPHVHRVHLPRPGFVVDQSVEECDGAGARGRDAQACQHQHEARFVTPSPPGVTARRSATTPPARPPAPRRSTGPRQSRTPAAAASRPRSARPSAEYETSSGTRRSDCTRRARSAHILRASAAAGALRSADAFSATLPVSAARRPKARNRPAARRCLVRASRPRYTVSAAIDSSPTRVTRSTRRSAKLVPSVIGSEACASCFSRYPRYTSPSWATLTLLANEPSTSMRVRWLSGGDAAQTSIFEQRPPAQRANGKLR